ncbi:MAG: hypothetical protein ACREAC_28500, partial [Blastocatellia bacterium]
MGTVSCPTIVFCTGRTGEAVGERLSPAADRPRTQSTLSLWAVRMGEGEQTIVPIGKSGGVDTQERRAVVSPTIEGAVSAVVADVLSLRDWRLLATMERPVNLRLSLVSATWEITPSALSDFAAAFRSAAHRHLGSTCVTDVCLLLPGLKPDGPNPDVAPDVADVDVDVAVDAGVETGNVHALLSAMTEAPPRNDPEFWPGSFTYCWWLDRINGSGLTLDRLPSSTGDIATAIGGLLATAPEHLPPPAVLAAPPLQMSAGYGELFVPREAVFECLRARYACQLIQRCFLDKRDRVNQKRARWRAWEFTLSPECDGALKGIEFTRGGERIWTGFDWTVPPPVFEGDVNEFLLNMRALLSRFLDSDLAYLRGQFESSGRARLSSLQKALDREAKDLAEGTEGGLFEA